MDWQKILWALALAMMIPFVWRSAKWWLANSPKPQKGDWTAAMFALALVGAFVLLLIKMVQ